MIIETRPNKQRSKDAIMSIWVVLVISLISVISSYYQLDLLNRINFDSTITDEKLEANDNREKLIGYYQLDLLNRINFDSTITDEKLEANDNREKLIGLLLLVAFIISAIRFIQWFRRAHYNLNLKTNLLSFNEEQVKWCWFDPQDSLYRPFRVMKDMHVKLIELLESNQVTYDQNISKSNINIWWALWIIYQFWFWSKFSTQLFSPKANTISELTDSTIFQMIGSGILIILSLATIKMVENHLMLVTLLEENEAKVKIPLENLNIGNI